MSNFITRSKQQYKNNGTDTLSQGVLHTHQLGIIILLLGSRDPRCKPQTAGKQCNFRSVPLLNMKCIHKPKYQVFWAGWIMSSPQSRSQNEVAQKYSIIVAGDNTFLQCTCMCVCFHLYLQVLHVLLQTQSLRRFCLQQLGGRFPSVALISQLCWQLCDLKIKCEYCESCINV